MAAQWWDPHGPGAPLHALNPCRLQYIQQYAKLESKNVLDVGCGAGILTESLAKSGANVIGIDAGEAMILAAKEHANLSSLSIKYVLSTIEDFAQQNTNKFAVITCMELIEHVPNPAQLIQACANLLLPGGYLFMSTINRTLKAYALAILGAEYILKILPKNTHDYKKFIQPAELSHMFKDANLRLVNVQGVKYNPFTKSATMHADVSINYMTCAVKEA